MDANAKEKKKKVLLPHDSIRSLNKPCALPHWLYSSLTRFGISPMAVSHPWHNEIPKPPPWRFPQSYYIHRSYATYLDAQLPSIGLKHLASMIVFGERKKRRKNKRHPPDHAHCKVIHQPVTPVQSPHITFNLCSNVLALTNTTHPSSRPPKDQ